MKVILVDDEQPARARMREILRTETDLEIIAECSNGDQAVEAIVMHQPDLIFLDIQMPGRNGFAVLQDLPPEDRPLVVFVTGYDEYAIKAFEVHAFDYILKPYSRERLVEVVQRVRQSRPGNISGQLDHLLRSLHASHKTSYPTRLVVRDGVRTSIVPIEDIVHLAAEGNYIEVCTTDRRRLLLRETMQALEARLDPSQFFRSSRSSIINLAHLKEIFSEGKSGSTLLMSDGEKVHLTASLDELQYRLSGSNTGKRE